MSYGRHNWAIVPQEQVRELQLLEENIRLKQRIKALEEKLGLLSTARFNELKAGFANFLAGVAKAQILRGILRASQGHTPVFGTNPQSAEPWTNYEIAKIFGASADIVARLEQMKAQYGLLRMCVEKWSRELQSEATAVQSSRWRYGK